MSSSPRSFQANASFRGLPVNVLLIVPPLLRGGNFVAARYVGDALPAAWLNIFRWSIAFAVLLPFGTRRLSLNRHVLRQDLCRLFLLSILGVIGFNSVTHFALHDLPANRAVAILALSPLFIILLRFILVAHLPPVRILLGATISLAGVVLGQDGVPQALSPSLFGPGWNMMLAALVRAAYCVALKDLRLSMTHLSALIVQIMIGVTLQGAVVLLTWGPPDMSAVSGSVIGAILFVGIFPAAIGFLVWQAAIQRARVTAAGVFMNLVQMFGVAFAWLFLSEDVGARELAGLVMVAFGISLAWTGNWSRRRKPLPDPARLTCPPRNPSP